jgi:hypothetical protein
LVYRLLTQNQIQGIILAHVQVFNAKLEGECDQELDEVFTVLEVLGQINLFSLCPSNKHILDVVQQIGIESLVRHDLDSLLGGFGLRSSLTDESIMHQDLQNASTFNLYPTK